MKCWQEVPNKEVDYFANYFERPFHQNTGKGEEIKIDNQKEVSENVQINWHC